MTGTIKMVSKGANQQVLDKLKVERERGITGESQQIVQRGCRLTMNQVKAQTARLVLLGFSPDCCMR
jgi:translation elongation factor EF-4